MPYNATPIYNRLKQYAADNILRLHMPGHIGRALSVQELKDIASIDVTEVPGLDDLHVPRDIIEQSRGLLARAFGAGESYFLVNGATSGIQTLFLALTAEGEKVLVPRNAHRSFFGGMVLSGAMPVYLPVQTMDEPGIALAVTYNDVKNLLDQSSKAVFLVSPSYYGTTCDLERIAGLVHASGKLLLVDEAHGAHFGFSPDLPPTALQCGADAVVNGLHKTLPVLNQGAGLHLASSLKGNQAIRNACSLLTTTSPSYPIMASIELGRALMEEKGEYLLSQA
ncbi:MAG TPA: aminotransferase class I/II-fold pyridoxal phosphate-dependent enzyme, partial [Syntrophomonadaceae bacterium]|nr:aminotransferase class I/II-fold pyridoxal phosphate-dependent enzyme [Syntrophomonadaceae bacterium]